MKIIIDDQYHGDDDNNYEERKYTTDEDGNLNLFIQVDGMDTSNNAINTVKKENIGSSKNEEENIVDSDFTENNSFTNNNFDNDFSTDEKYENVYDNFYSQMENKQYQTFNQENLIEEKGVIEVTSKLATKEGVELKGARINLYLLNGISPKLHDSKFSDNDGKVIFDNLYNGCYRVIAIVDRRFFEKPAYYNWNEVTIDKDNKHSEICVVNKIKMSYYRR